MLPLDHPELLEDFDHAGLSAGLPLRISGADTATDDFPTSLAALIVAEACNVGLVPIEKSNVPALTQALLQQVGVDHYHLRAKTIAAANTRPIRAQADIGIGQYRAAGTSPRPMGCASTCQYRACTPAATRSTSAVSAARPG
jgi:hypothetical protein